MSTPLGAAKADLEAVEAQVSAAGTSFYHGMRILPPDRRAAMYGIYGFCRTVDDIADGPGSFAEKLLGLNAWREEIEALYAGGNGDTPLTRVLAAAIARFDLRKDDFLAIITGMQMDAEAPIVAPNLQMLDFYCDCVAGAVGRLSVRAFGDASPAADRVAANLGRALQLTNILRDLREDAERGRLYLPREWLEEAGVPPEPAAALASPRLAQVCARLAILAHHHFAAAEQAMQECDPRAMRPARLMGAIYASMLARLERRGWDQPEKPVFVPAWQKLWIVLRFGFA